jgi:hypothetical protein
MYDIKKRFWTPVSRWILSNYLKPVEETSLGATGKYHHVLLKCSLKKKCQ